MNVFRAHSDKILFGLILLGAVLIRLYSLNSIPPGINRDEGSIGYTAYSLLKTGKDEYGRMFPISFQSFGDWKLPFYIYTTVLTVSLFGLSEFAVRIPSALFGISTVVLVYFFAKELYNRHVALITMALLAISPWHIHLSRVESESNTAVFFTTLGALFFFKSRKKKPFFLALSVLCFALTYFIYAGNHIFTTLLLVGFVWIFLREIQNNPWKKIASIVFVALVGFILYNTFFEASKTKLSGIGIFGDPSIIHAKIEIPRLEHTDPSGLWSRLVHNRAVFGTERFVQNYLNAFSPNFLFIQGGTNGAHNIQNAGNMHLVESIFLLMGVGYLLINKKRKEDKLILWWFFIAPIAVSITKDAPHTNRMFVIFPVLPLMVGMGVYWLFFKSTILGKWKKVIGLTTFLLFVFSLFLYIDRYFIHFPRNEAQNWGIGYKELVRIFNERENQTKQVIITNPEYSHYIFLLFYDQYDPSAYQASAVRYPSTEDAFVHVKGYGRFEFRSIDWKKEIQEPNKLLITFSQKLPKEIRLTSTFKEVTLPNGKSLFTIVESQ